MLKEDLPDFFKDCDLHPTEGEINKAFDSVFKGISVIFVDNLKDEIWSVS